MFRDLAPLFSYMRRYRWGYLWGTLSCICANGAWVLFPQILQRAIDALDHGVTRERILVFAGLLIAIALVKGVFLYAQRWILIGISRDIEFDLRNDLFRKLEEQDSGFYQRYRTGDSVDFVEIGKDRFAISLQPGLSPAAEVSAQPLDYLPKAGKINQPVH